MTALPLRRRLGPADVVVPAGRRYHPGTMALETTWATPGGWAVVRDVLLVHPRPCAPAGSAMSAGSSASPTADTYQRVTVTGAFGMPPKVKIPAKPGSGALYIKTVIKGTGTKLTKDRA